MEDLIGFLGTVFFVMFAVVLVIGCFVFSVPTFVVVFLYGVLCGDAIALVAALYFHGEAVTLDT